MKILLTGATGFIGTNFILRLHKKYDIVALVRNDSNIEKIKNYCQYYVYSNIKDLLVFSKQEKIDGIVHLATNWISQHSFNDIDNLVDSNILFGTYMLELSKQIDMKFFINASTFGSYCNSLKYRPSSLYAAMKKSFEDIMYYYSLTSKCVYTNILIFNVYGPNDKKPRLFTLLLDALKNNKSLDMSDGRQIVDYIHVYDVVSGFDLIIKNLSKNPLFYRDKIFSLKGNERQSLKDLISMFETIVNKKININWGARLNRELEIIYPWEGGDVLPGWNPCITLKDGLREVFSQGE
ncbi:SDR family oxidoreductase [Campylobacter sp. US25a]|uniref:NAD-dependent epimerase/dehydratase family protein n=1 Tax=Campylobacter sp. US25a TaxID=2498119 RepID=UPI001068BAC4|nr:NAD-dependent epimerase/dehydratase family protein [Campylobacter sp. US25a]TEY07363.1 SDR family oxidoreductase [Campylobacter sp. US25a]